MRRRADISVHSANGREEERKTAGRIYRIFYEDYDRARSPRLVGILLSRCS